MPRKKKDSGEDFGFRLSQSLKAATRRPTLHAYVPHAKQEEYHASTSRGTVFIGGNRSGKTVAGCVELLRGALGIDPYGKFPEPPLRLRACTVDLKHGIHQIVLPELTKWAPPSSLINGSFQDSWDSELQILNFQNGSFIEILTYEQDTEKHAGTSRHYIWFDEEAPKEIFDEGLGRLVDTDGRWGMTMTPVEGVEWIYQLYIDVVEEGMDHDIHFIQVDSYENPYISAAAVEAILGNLTEDERLARTKGMFRALGSKIFTNFGQKNIHPPFDIPSDWIRLEAMDHGLQNPTAWLFAAIDPKTDKIYIYDEMIDTNVTVDRWAIRLREKENKYGPPYYRVGDPSIKQRNAVTGTSIAYEYANQGLPIVLGNNDVHAGIGKVATLLGHDEKTAKLFIFSNLTTLITNLRKYRWAEWSTRKDRQSRNKKEEPLKQDDHDVDALRYLCAGWLDWKHSPPEPETGNVLGAPTAIGPNPTPEDFESIPVVDSILGDEW